MAERLERNIIPLCGRGHDTGKGSHSAEWYLDLQGTGLRPASGQSALLGLEARVRLVDHVNATLATDDLAVAVTALERFQRRTDFHGRAAGLSRPELRERGNLLEARLPVNRNAAPACETPVSADVNWP
jgi:hypothetical protein